MESGLRRFETGLHVGCFEAGRFAAAGRFVAAGLVCFAAIEKQASKLNYLLLESLRLAHVDMQFSTILCAHTKIIWPCAQWDQRIGPQQKLLTIELNQPNPHLYIHVKFSQCHFKYTIDPRNASLVQARNYRL